MDNRRRVLEVFKSVFPQSEDANALYLGDNFWDSLKHIELVTALEEEFGLEFTLEDMGRMRDFGTVLDTVASWASD